MNENVPARPVQGDATELSARVLDVLADAVVVVDNMGWIRCLNPAGERLLGWTAARARGRQLGDCLSLRDGCDGHPVPWPLVHLLARDDRHAPHHDLLVQPDGREIPIEAAATPLTTAAGEVSGIVILIHGAADACAEVRRLNAHATCDDLTRLGNRSGFERRTTDGVLAEADQACCAAKRGPWTNVHGGTGRDTEGTQGGDAAGFACPVLPCTSVANEHLTNS